MIMFKAHYYFTPRIIRREVLSVTDHFIILSPNNRRESKKTQYESWHDTFEEAKEACVSEFRRKISMIEQQLETANEKLKEAQSITEENIHEV